MAAFYEAFISCIPELILDSRKLPQTCRSWNFPHSSNCATFRARTKAGTNGGIVEC